MSDRVLVKNIGDLVTLAPLAQSGRAARVTPDDLGRLGPGAWLAVGGGKVAAAGAGAVPVAYRDWPETDAGGGLVLPGLVDAHTHPIFGGSRAAEFWQRANGATYQEVAAAGGGIRSTVTATRQAGDEELLASLGERLARIRRLGVTTVEVKSGYGLSVSAELRLLRLLHRARASTRQHLEITCLALHDRSPEQPDLAAYVAACTSELLPVVAREGLAGWVDAFIETGYYGVADAEPYVRKAKELGLGIRLHADEFSDAGGAAAAAAWGAASADHLQHATGAGIEAMAAAGVTATILPGTSLYTKIPFANARRFADRGVPVAIASDFNPGSCRIDNLAMLATVAAIQCGFRPAEAVAGVTYVPARALGLGGRKGALMAGYDADLLIYKGLGGVEEWLADFGRTPPQAVYIAGQPC